MKIPRTLGSRSFIKTESYMSVSSMFEVFLERNSTKKDINDLAIMLENAGYKRNSRKQFLICTEYVAPLYKFKSKSIGSNSVIDFTDSISDESEDMMVMLEALA